MGDIAFVLGNGVSRSDIDVNLLKPLGTVYGCNAIYRDYIVDHLVAVDVKMILEIDEAGYQYKTNVWTNPNKHTENIPGINRFEYPLGWSSGPTALDLAAKNGHKYVYIIGFDFVGIGDRFNNVYAGTKNYKKSDDPATYYANWAKQTTMAIDNHKSTKFYRVVNDGAYIPKNFPHLNNLKHLNINSFIERIQNMQ